MAFNKGFGKYLKTGEFSDIELVTKKRAYKLHKIILLYSSEFFDKLLTSGFKESNQKKIELNIDDPEDVFPQVVRYFYTGHIIITSKNAIPLLSIADQLFLYKLHKKTLDFICKNINRENVIIVLKEAIKFNAISIIEKSIEIISKNFYRFQATIDWTFLPHLIFLKLLSQEYLTIKDEYSLYRLVKLYVEKHNNNLTNQQIVQLMEQIRFRWVDLNQLQEIEQDLLVPRSIFIEAIMARLRASESNLAYNEEDEKNQRLRPRVSFGMQFDYTFDFDQKGIIYWISTNGDKEPWRNPHSTKRVIVTASSIAKGETKDLLSQTPSELWTDDVPASWFCIDLGDNRTILTTHYTLRHGGNYKGDCLRTWDFQGSINGRDWTVLKRHTNDQSLNGPFGTNTWPLSVEKAYRYFRVLQTGHNSANHNFLVLSGFELYGDLYEFEHDY